MPEKFALHGPLMLPVSPLGRDPVITGRSGSPSMKLTTTSVPGRSGKAMPESCPACGPAMRIQQEALPPLLPDRSKGKISL